MHAYTLLSIYKIITDAWLDGIGHRTLGDILQAVQCESKEAGKPGLCTAVSLLWALGSRFSFYQASFSCSYPHTSYLTFSYLISSVTSSIGQSPFFSGSDVNAHPIKLSIKQTCSAHLSGHPFKLPEIAACRKLTETSSEQEWSSRSACLKKCRKGEYHLSILCKIKPWYQDKPYWGLTQSGRLFDVFLH